MCAKLTCLKDPRGASGSTVTETPDSSFGNLISTSCHLRILSNFKALLRNLQFIYRHISIIYTLYVKCFPPSIFSNIWRIYAALRSTSGKVKWRWHTLTLSNDFVWAFDWFMEGPGLSVLKSSTGKAGGVGSNLTNSILGLIRSDFEDLSNKVIQL